MDKGTYLLPVQHEKIKNPSEDLVNGAILGGADFINWVKKAFLMCR